MPSTATLFYEIARTKVETLYGDVLDAARNTASLLDLWLNYAEKSDGNIATSLYEIAGSIERAQHFQAELRAWRQILARTTAIVQAEAQSAAEQQAIAAANDPAEEMLGGHRA